MSILDENAVCMPKARAGYDPAASLRGMRAALLLALALALCAAQSQANPLTTQGASASSSPTAEIVLRTLALMGVPYRAGGHSPDTGMDCSGLVRHVFQEAFGMALPRRSEEMGRIGEAIEAADLRPGDLVFFDTLRSAFSHVGVYIGAGRFVHAPTTGGQVRIEAMARPYWASRFNGARRLLLDGLGLERLAAHPDKDD